MNINATEADLHAAAEALKLAAILDDRVPKADKARITAWAEKFHAHKLNRVDILDGLQRFYDHPSDRAIQIGDLLQQAHAVKRDRLDREADAEREARRAAADAKAADETQALAAVVQFGPITHPTERLKLADDALQSCYGKREAQVAIREFFTAKREASKAAPKKRGNPVGAA